MKRILKTIFRKERYGPLVNSTALGKPLLKPILLYSLLCLIYLSASAQTVEWTWVSGDNTVDEKGWYGTKGVANSRNKPGARQNGAEWIDDNGDLWLFGGYGYGGGTGVGYLNDLWRYDESASKWIWTSGDTIKNQTSVYGTQGTGSTSNKPGGVWGGHSWMDTNGDLWYFGGQGKGAASTVILLNTLWKYDVSSGKWTWVTGSQGTETNGTYGTLGTASSSNTPGSRHRFVGWEDETGDFWLFGGFGRAASGTNGSLSDLWKFETSSEKWTWMHGSSSKNGGGTYGTISQSATSNAPGARHQACATLSSEGDLWLYGGTGYDGGANSGTLNDLWEYNLDNNEWTWLSGNNTHSHNHTYGSIGVAAGANHPGDRLRSLAWADGDENFYLYGGHGNTGQKYGDLWRWDGTNWTWISGSSSDDPSAKYPTLGQGVAQTTKTPGYRRWGSTWVDSDGSFWCFGGLNTSDYFNDLWKCQLIYKIENGEKNEEARSEFKIISGENTGEALQDGSDYVEIIDQTFNLNNSTTNLPSASNIVTRQARSWRLKINDQGNNGGSITIEFDLLRVPNSDVTYYLIHQAAGAGAYFLQNDFNYKVSGNKVVFSGDIDDLTHRDYYAIGWSGEDAGYALDFDKASTSDKVTLPVDLDASTSNFSLECWFNPSSTSGTQVIMGQNTGTGTPRSLLTVKANGTIITTLGNATNASTSTVTANKWYHGAVTYDGSTIKLYLDGKLEKSASVTAEGCDGTWVMGVSHSGGSAFDGQMDEMRIWNDVRTESEIRKNMYHPLAGNEANLLAYYKFDQVSSTFLPDVSSNSNSGTLSNFSLSGSNSNWVASDAPIVARANANQIAGPGNGLEFDGSNDYVSVSNFLDPSSSSWTAEGWFNTDVTSTSTLITQANGSASSNGRVYLRIANGVLETYLGGSKISGTTSLQTGEWYHAAIVYDGTTVKTYLNGLLEISKVKSISTCDGDLIIGSNKSFASNFNGKMDEWRFWSSTRTQAEIQDNMYASVDEDASGLTAYYSCDYLTGTTLTDLTSNSNDGTLNNFPTTCWVSASAREPFKTIKAGTHGTGSTWKNGSAPSSSSDRMAIFHDVILSSSGTYERLQVNSGVNLTASADLTVSGDVIVNGTLAGSNKLILNGSAKQCLGGSGNLGALQVNNSNDISLEGDLTISGALTLTSGDVEVNDHTLTLSGTTSHGSSSSYLKLNGTGSVKATVGSSTVIIPVGRNPYLPVIIDDGGGAEYTVGVADKVYSNPATQTTELTTNCVSETWTVQSNQSASNVSIQVGWDAAEETTGFSRSACAVAHWENGVSSSWTQGTNGTSSGSDPYFQTTTITSMSTNLYYFGVGSAGSPLPVELSYFNAEWAEANKNVNLTWETVTEINNSHFEVQRALRLRSGAVAESSWSTNTDTERSRSGSGSGSGTEMNWEVIAQFAGRGTTLSPTQYSYTDHIEHLESKPEVLYYRLKQVDFNGEFEYSEIRTLQTNEESELQFELYPNPATTQLHISTSFPIEEVKIYNALGKLIMTVHSSNSIDISTLPTGNYYLETRPKHLQSPAHRSRFLVE